MPILFRVLLIVPTAALIWWFSGRIVNPDEDNWILWIMHSDGSKNAKVIWGLIGFGGCIAVGGSMFAMGKHSYLILTLVMLVSYCFAAVIGAGIHTTTGFPMPKIDFWTLALAMACAVPMVFVDQIVGNQTDVAEE